MYMTGDDDEAPAPAALARLRIPVSATVGLVVAVAFTIVVGVFPSRVANLSDDASFDVVPPPPRRKATPRLRSRQAEQLTRRRRRRRPAPARPKAEWRRHYVSSGPRTTRPEPPRTSSSKIRQSSVRRAPRPDPLSASQNSQRPSGDHTAPAAYADEIRSALEGDLAVLQVQHGHRAPGLGVREREQEPAVGRHALLGELERRHLAAAAHLAPLVGRHVGHVQRAPEVVGARPVDDARSERPHGRAARHPAGVALPVEQEHAVRACRAPARRSRVRRVPRRRADRWSRR